MKKITLLLITIVGACLFSYAQTTVAVTFRVDLNTISDLYDGGSVWIYMDAGWSEYYDMTDEDADGIYEYTMNLESGTTFTYRFSYQNGADPDYDYVEENVPTDCANEDGFREITIPENDAILDVVAFGSCDNETNPKVTITFQVDMSLEDNPNNVMVVIKNPWIWTALTDNGDGIWSGAVEVDANTEYPYTFVNGGQDNWDGEESISGDCNFGTETAPERHIAVAEENLSTDLVYFGQCDHETSVTSLNTSTMEIYPNPTKHMVRIESADLVLSVQLYDMSGKLIQEKGEINAKATFLNLTNIESGVYFIQLNSFSKKYTKKLIVN